MSEDDGHGDFIGSYIPRASGSASVRRSAIARKQRRKITPQALEKLGHAVEYLTDEFVKSGVAFSASNSQLEAVQLLMALNRRVYFECPEVPTLGERLRSLLHRATN